MASYYTAPESFVGKDLSDLRSSYSEPFRTDILAQMLGIPERGQAFTSGQNLKYTPLPGMANSAEEQFINKYLTPGQSPEQQQATTAQNKIAESTQQAVNTVQSGIEPLKAKYTQIIDSIKQKRTGAVASTQTAASQEFARRGIPVQSSNFNDFLTQKLMPVEETFGGLEAQAGLDSQKAQQDILNIISQLQAGGGLNEANLGLSYAQLAEQQRQTDLQNAISQGQLGINQQVANKTETQSPYTTLSEGQTLFNLLTGQAQYTAPKTYKPESGGNNDPLGLL